MTREIAGNLRTAHAATGWIWGFLLSALLSSCAKPSGDFIGIQSLSLSPSTASITVANSVVLSATDGVEPYLFRAVSGPVNVDPRSGIVTPTGVTGNAVVEVSDQLGQATQAWIMIAPALQISANSVTIAQGNTFSFSSTGGIAPLVYSIRSGPATIDPFSGQLIATAPGTAQVRLSDALGNTSDATVTIEPPLSISPATIAISPNDTQSFAAGDGVPPYRFAMLAGTGTINAATGLYTAPGANETDTLRVTDSYGNTADATVIVSTTPVILPHSITITTLNSASFAAGGGTPPYAFAVTSGGGSVTAGGVYSPAGGPGTATVSLSDSLGHSDFATVSIHAPPSISPSSKTLAVGNSVSFGTSDGVGPFSYTIISGGGSINASSGAYTAPAASGTAIVRSTDSLGNTSDATITINPAPSITPASKTLAVNNVFTFATANGVGPYSYSIISGSGSVNAASGVYTAPASPGTAVVRSTDSLGNTSEATITINPALAISPTAKTLAVGNSITFSSLHGVSPYSYSLVSGGGSINAASGAYTAPASSGAAIVRSTDSLGNTSDATVTINPAPAISPSIKTIAVSNSVGFATSNGVGPYAYSVTSGGGSIDASTGVYTAPASPGTATVRSTDSLGNTSDATVTINPALSISPTSKTLAVGNSATFTSSNGVGPYSYSVLSGGGSVDPSSGAYTAPATSGTATVRSTDSLGNTSDAAVTINPALSISPAAKTLAVGNSATFTSSNGVGPYSYSLLSGGGSVNASSGAYTAPATSGTATVRSTDSLGNTSDATITINPALSISPASKTLAVGNSATFTSSNGVGPYSYSLLSGGGSVNASSGAYTAPATSGTATVRSTDSLGNTSDAAVTINPALSISPATKTLAVGNSATFTSSNGVGPYSYSLLSGGGSVNASSGAYTAPATSGTATVRSTDSLGNTSDATVTINPSPSISPATKTLAVGNSVTFSTSNGVGPYSYSVLSGGGSINPSSGAYTAPATSGTATVRSTDSLGNTSDAAVTINPALSISPAAKTLAVGNSATFTSSNGVGPYSYSLVSGGGSVNASSGVYTAPATSGTATVRSTDSLGNTSDAAVTINPALSISPASKTLAVGNSVTFTSSNGVGPYSYSLVSGGGSVSVISGAYTAPATSGTATVRSTDSLGNTSDAAVTINPALSISPASKTLAVGNSVTFTSSNGVGPYTYTVVSGAGSVNASSGVYTAPTSAGTAVVRSTDSLGNTSNASITINPALAISPAAKTLAVGNSATFTSTNGVGPYTYTVVSGGGSVNASSGAYTAPASSGTASVRSTDSLGNTSDATVTINSALAITPSTTTLMIGNSFGFAAAGGVPPIAFTVSAGSGTINSGNGQYTAPGGAGVDTVQATDSLGNSSTATVTINPALTMLPSAPILAVGNPISFSPTGGVPPYSYAVVSGNGTLTSSGNYRAPGSAGTDTVSVTDSLGNSNSTTVTINPALQISPNSKSVATSTSYSFTSSGGVSPFTYSVLTGGGAINASSGLYTAPGSAANAIVRITDSLGNTSDASVAVVVPTVPVSITPASVTLSSGEVFAFSASNGVTPYTYSVVAGSGSIDPSSGIFFAPVVVSNSSVSVMVTDDIGSTSTSTVTVLADLKGSPASLSLAPSESTTLGATGGMSPYTYSLVAGGGTVNSTSGAYSAPSSTGRSVISITDAAGAVKFVPITVVEGLALAPASVSILPNSSLQFSASGGVAPYSYSIAAGAGSITSAGLYNASSSTGNVTVQVMDSHGNTQTAALAVAATASPSLSPILSELPGGGTISFSASGGLAPYTYGLVNGPAGTINSATGAYVAASGYKLETVQVKDSLNTKTQALVMVIAAPVMSPASVNVASAGSFVFGASGGKAPYSFSMVSGGGTIDPNSGTYAAPTLNGSITESDTVRITDSYGRTSTATVTVYPPVAITPASKTLGVSQTATFTASSGLAPYTYSVQSGAGSINSSGVFTAPGTGGTSILLVTDSLGQTATAQVTTVSTSPSISPPTKSLASGNAFYFSGSGGVPQYHYSIVSGGGTIDNITGRFVAPTVVSKSTTIVRLTDLASLTSDAAITVTPPLAISPSSASLGRGGAKSFTASGGVPPYTYSIMSGAGTVNASGGFSAPNTTGRSVVLVTDSLGNTSGAAVTIVGDLALGPSKQTVAKSSTLQLQASGGVAPYSYSIASGIGSVNSSGLYTAPASTGTASVQVTDANGSTATAAITIAASAGPAISPVSIDLPASGTTTFSTSGGTPGYQYSGTPGQINSSSGFYTAPSNAAIANLTSKDSLNIASSAVATIYAPIAASTTSVNLAPSNAFWFGVGGGKPPYTFAMASGGGTIDANSGLYTAAASGAPMTDTIRITGSLGQSTTATVQVSPTLQISPASTTVQRAAQVTFSASGGVSPYLFSIESGAGSITSGGGKYTAPNKQGSAVIQVRDAQGNLSFATVSTP